MTPLTGLLLSVGVVVALMAFVLLRAILKLVGAIVVALALAGIVWYFSPTILAWLASL